MGGDGVKVLAWFRLDAAPEVIEHQERFVRQMGEDCRRFDSTVCSSFWSTLRRGD